jgi:hypothetical protein
MIDDLLADAAGHVLTSQSVSWRSGALPDDEVERAAQVVSATPDESTYLVLMALRRDAPAAYSTLPPGVRAAVLVAALRTLTFLNDFGYLEPDESWDAAAAHALVECGASAVPLLRAALDDLAPAPLRGSEEATLATLHGCRRADFAYRYLALLLGRPAVFLATPEARDVLIAEARTWPDAAG